MPWDIFDSDAFSVMTLTHTVSDRMFTPTRLGDMGLYSYQGVTTTKVAIERQDQQLALVPVTPRNAPPIQNVMPRRNILAVETPRLAMEDAVFADEVQNIRAFGSESGVQQLATLLNNKLDVMNRKIDLTLEHHRIGALRGTILDADGSTLYDLFDLFGVLAQSEVDFVLGTSTTDIRLKIATVINAIEDELGGYSAPGGYHAFVGRDFMTALQNHPTILETYKYQQSQVLREGFRQTLTYGGMTFEQYHVTIGGTAFIPVDGGVVFPRGVPDMFIGRFAPAEWWETVNTVGLPRYARQTADQRGDRRNVEVRTFPLHLNCRPRAVVPITTSN